ncbi:MAG TPA: dihydrodipicolinate synthase family protein [Pyrinomonadaceae bacterium]|nr:dihydrodipicolinate synthase family protein [Pyrinomonadaceae bacterium]
MIGNERHPQPSALSNRLRGVLLPITTPFDFAQKIDLQAARANLHSWAQTAISGFVVLGSTGERVHLDEREYIEIIESARREVSDELAFIVGAGQQSTIGTINEIKRAAEGGADAVLVITPNFYRSAITQETLIKHYSEIADASPVPVILYSMPVLTGIKIETATIARLSDHQNIIGVKDSSADVEGFKQTVELCPKEFAVMTGNGTIFLGALRAGATGAILAVGCAVPEVCVEIMRAFTDGEEERAQLLQSKLTPLATAVTTKYGIGGLKAALDMGGYVGGSVRAPLSAPTENAKVEIEQLLEEVKNVSDRNAVYR